MSRKDKYDEQVWRAGVIGENPLMSGAITGDYPPGFTVGDFGEPQPVWSNPAFTTPTMQTVKNITRRDFFAGLAMCGLLSQEGCWEPVNRAVYFAAELIKELDKTK